MWQKAVRTKKIFLKLINEKRQWFSSPGLPHPLLLELHYRSVNEKNELYREREWRVQKVSVVENNIWLAFPIFVCHYSTLFLCHLGCPMLALAGSKQCTLMSISNNGRHSLVDSSGRSAKETLRAARCRGNRRRRWMRKMPSRLHVHERSEKQSTVDFRKLIVLQVFLSKRVLARSVNRVNYHEKLLVPLGYNDPCILVYVPLQDSRWHSLFVVLAPLQRLQQLPWYFVGICRTRSFRWGKFVTNVRMRAILTSKRPTLLSNANKKK